MAVCCENQPEEPTISFVFVREAEVQSHRPGLAALKATLVQLLRDLDAEIHVADSQNLWRTARQTVGAGRLVVVSEGVNGLKAARGAFSNHENCTHAILVVPTSYPDWGSRTKFWAEGLKKALDEDTIVVTDSELSRRVVERYLAAFRADVRVLYPTWGSVNADHLPQADPWVVDFAEAKQSATDPHAARRWSFGAAKAAAEPSSLQTSGVRWNFTRSLGIGSTSESDGHEVEPDDGQKQLNATLIKELARPSRLSGAPVNLGILGTKLTFIDELSRDLARATGSKVVLDEWKYLATPDNLKRSQEILVSSDVVIGEWARPNNVWIQENAPRDTMLIVRAHRYEVTVDFPRKIDMSRFNAAVVIVPWVGRTLVQKFGWPAEKLVYIPNYVNSRHFSRTKLPGAEYTLGLVGITPDLKRIDLALDLLEKLRAEDLRYSFRVRGGLPPSHINWDKEDSQAEQWGSVLHRIEKNPILRNSVHFDPPGRDMAAWYEQIGTILSTSDLEGSHVALAEGIASGALPVARRWPGIGTLWPSDFTFDSIDDAAQWVLQSRNSDWRRAEVDRLKSLACLDQDKVLGAWWDLIGGDVQKAQAAFGPVDWKSNIYEPIRFD